MTIVNIPGGSADGQLNYDPPLVKVVIGSNNTIAWFNTDDVVHTVTSENGTFSSGDINAGGSFTFTINAPGIYLYHCIYHPWLKGKVIVLAGGSTSTRSQSMTFSTSSTSALSSKSTSSATTASQPTQSTGQPPSGQGSLPYVVAGLFLIIVVVLVAWKSRRGRRV